MTKVYVVTYMRFYSSNDMFGGIKVIVPDWKETRKEFPNKESAMTFIRRIQANVLVNKIYLDYYFR